MCSRYVDPCESKYCSIIDAIVAVAGSELLGGAALGGAEALGAGAALGAGEAAASITLPEVLTTAIAPEVLGGGTEAGFFGGGLDAALGGTFGTEAAGLGASGLAAGDFGSSILGSVGGAAPGEAIQASASALPLTTQATPPSLAPEFLGSPVTSGAAGGAPAAPASIGPLSPTATGALDATAGGGTLGPGAELRGGDLASGVWQGGGGPISGSPDSGGSTLLGRGTSGLDKALTEATGGNFNLKDAGMLTSLGGLGMNLLNREKPLPGQKQVATGADTINNQGQALIASGEQLSNYLKTGTLPAGVQSGIDQAKAAAMASVRSQHAKAGTSGSSAEMADLQAAADRAQTAGADIGLKLLQQGQTQIASGINAEGLASQIYRTIQEQALQEDQALGQAIGAFGAALSSGAPQPARAAA